MYVCPLSLLLKKISHDSFLLCCFFLVAKGDSYIPTYRYFAATCRLVLVAEVRRKKLKKPTHSVCCHYGSPSLAIRMAKYMIYSRVGCDWAIYYKRSCYTQKSYLKPCVCWRLPNILSELAYRTLRAHANPQKTKKKNQRRWAPGQPTPAIIHHYHYPKRCTSIAPIRRN